MRKASSFIMGRYRETSYQRPKLCKYCGKSASIFMTDKHRRPCIACYRKHLELSNQQVSDILEGYQDLNEASGAVKSFDFQGEITGYTARGSPIPKWLLQKAIETRKEAKHRMPTPIPPEPRLRRKTPRITPKTPKLRR